MTKNPQPGIEKAIARADMGSSASDNAQPQGIACTAPFDAVPAKEEGVVSTLQGALVLGGPLHVDFALPGALPLVWQRRYTSYVSAEQGGICGVLGHGWRVPLELRLTLSARASLLHDVDGRTITLGALAPGACQHSASEDLWLLRSQSGSASSLPAWHAAHEGRFAHLPPHLASRANVVFVCHGSGDEVWTFAPANRKALEDGSEAEPSSQWQLLGKIDRLGRTQRYRYAEVLGEQRLVAVQDGVGRCYRLRYEQIRAPRPEPRYPSGHFWQADGGVRLTLVEWLAPREGSPQPVEARPLVRYVYSAEGDLIEVQRELDEPNSLPPQRFAYNHHLLVLHQQRGGPEHHYRYERSEPGARIIEQRSQLGLTREFSYQTLPREGDEPRSKTLVMDSFKRHQSHAFKGLKGLARLVRKTQFDGGTTHCEYDAEGRLLTSTDALGQVTRITRDAQGRVIATRHADGSESTQIWDESTGLLMTTRDAEGRKTRYGYDDQRRLTRVEHADGSVRRMVYPEPASDPCNADRPVLVADGAGEVTTFGYTPEGLIQLRTDAAGNSTEFAYNDAGQMTQMRNALGVVEYRDLAAAEGVHRHYDLWGRLIELEQAGASMHWQYDEAGRLIAITNQNGDRAQLQWDAMDRIARFSGFDQRVMTWRYNAAGQLIESTDGCADAAAQPPISTRYEWNERGWLSACHQPETADAPACVTRYQWSREGELQAASTWRCGDAGCEVLASQVLLERDAMGRIVAETQRLLDEKSGAVEFEHRIVHKLDAAGRRIGNALDGLGEVGFALNEAGVMQALQWQGERLLECERDALLRETSRRLVHGGLRREVQWTATNQWQRVQWSTRAGEEAAAEEERDLAPDTPLAAVAHALAIRRFKHDEQGKVIAIQSPFGMSRFAYDACGRMTAAHTPQAGLQRWSYDPTGLRLPQPCEVLTVAHADGKDTCDADGEAQRRESELAHTQRWIGARVQYYTNAFDPMTNGARLRYTHDSHGNRTQVQDLKTGHETRMRYDAAHQLVALSGIDAAGQKYEQRMRHDPLGRRLVTYLLDDKGRRQHSDYVGWDGDLPVRAERHALSDVVTVHTIYEPGTRHALVQLHRGRASQAAPAMAVQTLPANVAPITGQSDDPRDMQSMLKRLEDLDARIKARLGSEGLTACNQAFRVRQLKAAQATQSAQMPMSSSSCADEKENAEMPVRVLHCMNDHDGTLLGLASDQGEVVWAAMQDPWGLQTVVHNPQNLYQPFNGAGALRDESHGLLYREGNDYDAMLGQSIACGTLMEGGCAAVPGLQKPQATVRDAVFKTGGMR